MRILHYTPQVKWDDPRADYDRILRMRAANLREILKHKNSVPALLAHYADGRWAEFISDWGMTFDPRELDPDLRYRPFILYKRQIEYVDWVYQRYMKRERGLCKKFRGAGISWLNMAISAMPWLAVPDTAITISSQKEEKVDNGPDDKKSLFWKLRKFVEMLPAPMQPEGWQDASKRMLLVNPQNGSTVVGEIGDQIGRGDRATIAFPDEFAELDHQELVESSLAETADCVIYSSTVPQKNGVGTKFYELEHQFPEEQVFVFQWIEDERKRLNPHLPAEQEPWYLKKKAEVSPTVFASQFLLDYSAATSNSFVGAGLIRDRMNYPLSRVNQPPDLPWRIGVDAAGMGNDKIKIWRRRGRLSLPALTYEKMKGPALAMVVEKVAGDLLASAPVESIVIERDGPGGSCADQLELGPFASIVVALHTGARLGDGKHYNLRAWLHSQAKEYLELPDVHIPDSPTFLSQGSAIQYEYKGGLLLIESKDDYRARFSSGRSRAEKKASRSPDEWDSFMLTFAPPIGKPIYDLGAVADSKSPEFGWAPQDAAYGY